MERDDASDKSTADRNPYAPPTSQEPLLRPERKRSVEFGRPYAMAALGLSILSALAWVFLDEVLLMTQIGAWPMLIGCSAVSVLVAWRTRDWVIAPLCCVVPTMSGDLMAGVVRDWSYAQVPIALQLSLAFSVPALLVAWISAWRARSWSAGPQERADEMDRSAIESSEAL